MSVADNKCGEPIDLEDLGFQHYTPPKLTVYGSVKKLTASGSIGRIEHNTKQTWKKA